MGYLHKLKRIFIVLIFAICTYSIFCMPVKAMSIGEAVRSGELKIDNNEFIVDKQLTAYAGLESYDSRKYIKTYVFNQQNTGTCWINAGLMTLTVANDKNNQGRYIFSRRHAGLTITGNVMVGGHSTTLAGYITSGKGPVLEIDMPWKSMETDEEIKQNSRADKTEKELLKTLTPIIKLNSWERLPAIYKDFDENGNISYFQLLRKTTKEIKNEKSKINEYNNQLKLLEEEYKKEQQELLDAYARQTELSNQQYELIKNRE